MEQWATGEILSNSDYGYPSNYTAFNSSYYLPMGFGKAPELSSYYSKDVLKCTNGHLTL
jgi:hypothetical protein